MSKNWREKKRLSEQLAQVREGISSLTFANQSPEQTRDTVAKLNTLLNKQSKIEKALVGLNPEESPPEAPKGIDLRDAQEKPWLFDWEAGQPVARRNPEQLDEIGRKLCARGLCFPGA